MTMTLRCDQRNLCSFNDLFQQSFSILQKYIKNNYVSEIKKNLILQIYILLENFNFVAFYLNLLTYFYKKVSDTLISKVFFVLKQPQNPGTVQKRIANSDRRTDELRSI